MSKEGRSGALVAQVPSRARAALKLYALLTEGARARPRDTVAQLAPARARVRNTATRAAYRCVRACSCWMLALVGAMFPRRWRWGMRGVGGLAAGAKRGSARSSFSSQASAAAPMRHGGGRARQSHVRARARARKGTLGGPHAERGEGNPPRQAPPTSARRLDAGQRRSSELASTPPTRGIGTTRTIKGGKKKKKKTSPRPPPKKEKKKKRPRGQHPRWAVGQRRVRLGRCPPPPPPAAAAYFSLPPACSKHAARPVRARARALIKRLNACAKLARG